MVNVDIDTELYEDVKSVIKKHRYEFPSIKFFVQKAIYKEILNSTNDGSFHDFYAKLKEILRENKDVVAKIDQLYDSEIKRGVK